MCTWMLVHLGVCLLHLSLPPPLYLISASVHHQEGEERSVRQLFIVYRIGILWVFPGRKKNTHNGAGGGSHFNRKASSALVQPSLVC